MPIFCVSDLHLCDRGYRDNFAVEGREARFHKFLDYVEAEGGQLYILGDLFDWWQVNLSKSVRAYRDLLARLARVGSVGALWIAGNHDNALADFIGSEIKLGGLELPAMSKAFEATIGGRRFAFLHGHESDSYCRDLNPGTGEITAIISGLLVDRNRGSFDRHYHAIEDQFVGTLRGSLGTLGGRLLWCLCRSRDTRGSRCVGRFGILRPGMAGPPGRRSVLEPEFKKWCALVAKHASAGCDGLVVPPNARHVRSTGKSPVPLGPGPARVGESCKQKSSRIRGARSS